MRYQLVPLVQEFTQLDIKPSSKNVFMQIVISYFIDNLKTDNERIAFADTEEEQDLKGFFEFDTDVLSD